MTSTQSFGIGDLVEVDTPNVRALARVRESSGGRLHVALEVGEYLPWVDDQVLIRHFGNDPLYSCTAKILHAGSSTALLQIIEMVEEVRTPPAGLPSLQGSRISTAPQRGRAAPSSIPPNMPPIDDDW